jgi:D-beta-D-heptose 7-phosphate kinase/D-beta-D-heptose 1-phosphate adenosyltransferase
MKVIVVVSGGFDPVHSGHILMFNAAKSQGTHLIVGINSDDWLRRKKGAEFMPWSERSEIVSNFKAVDEVMAFDDSDGTACDLLDQVKRKYPSDIILFANGGDRTSINIPEMTVKGVNFLFGIGGEHKANSSSWILEKWKYPVTERIWGHYRVLYDIKGCKVKELVVKPGHSLSMQRHQHRAEFWFVSEGEATVYWDEHGSSKITQHKNEVIHQGEWHKLVNNTDKSLKVVEIQYGTLCDESDIERR